MMTQPQIILRYLICLTLRMSYACTWIVVWKGARSVGKNLRSVKCGVTHAKETIKSNIQCFKIMNSIEHWPKFRTRNILGWGGNLLKSGDQIRYLREDQTKENQKLNRTSGYKNVNNMRKTFLKSTTGLDLGKEIGGKDDFSIARRNRWLWNL